MTARFPGKARPALHHRGAVPLPQDVGPSFDIADYVKASRGAQQLPETVDDLAALERLVALLRVAALEASSQARAKKSRK
jgi:hypothetical protein